MLTYILPAAVVSGVAIQADLSLPSTLTLLLSRYPLPFSAPTLMAQLQPVWHTRRVQHINGLEAAHSRLDLFKSSFSDFVSAFEPILPSSAASNPHNVNTPSVEADGLLNRVQFSAQVSSIRDMMNALSGDIMTQLSRCTFEDPLTGRSQVIGARVGVAGKENQGKSSFVSCWASNGASYTLLPEDQHRCTGTTVRVYNVTRDSATPPRASGAAVPLYRANVFFWTTTQIRVQLREVFSKISSNTTPQEAAAGLHANLFLEDNLLQHDMEVIIPAFANQVIDSADRNRELIRNIVLRWNSIRVLIGADPITGIGSNSATQFREEIERYVSVRHADTVSGAVSHVDIYAHFEGLTTGIQLNDLPGVDSASEELNQMTYAEIDKMDLVILLKETSINAELLGSDKSLLERALLIDIPVSKRHERSIQQRRSVDRVMVCLTRQDEDWCNGDRMDEKNQWKPLMCEETLRFLAPYNIPPANIHLTSVYLSCNQRYRQQKLGDIQSASYKRAHWATTKLNTLFPYFHFELSTVDGEITENLNGMNRFRKRVNEMLNDYLPALDEKALNAINTRMDALAVTVTVLLRKLSSQPILAPTDAADPYVTYLIQGDSTQNQMPGMLEMLERALQRCDRCSRGLTEKLDNAPSTTRTPVASLPGAPPVTNNRGDAVSRLHQRLSDSAWSLPRFAGDAKDSNRVNYNKNQKEQDEDLLNFITESVQDSFTNTIDIGWDNSNSIVNRAQAEIDKRAKLEAMSFGTVEGFYRRLLFETLLANVLTSVKECEQWNIIQTADYAIKALVETVSSEGSLLPVIQHESKSPEIYKRLMKFRELDYTKESLPVTDESSLTELLIAMKHQAVQKTLILYPQAQRILRLLKGVQRGIRGEENNTQSDSISGFWKRITGDEKNNPGHTAMYREVITDMSGGCPHYGELSEGTVEFTEHKTKLERYRALKTAKDRQIEDDEKKGFFTPKPNKEDFARLYEEQREYNAELAALEKKPAQCRLAHLSSLFCAPLTMTRYDLEKSARLLSFNRAQGPALATATGEAQREQVPAFLLPTTGALKETVDALFHEVRSVFVEDGEWEKLFGVESSSRIFYGAVHLRIIDCLKHLSEIIDFEMRNDKHENALVANRVLVLNSVRSFWGKHKQKFENLMRDNKRVIWPHRYGENVQADNIKCLYSRCIDTFRSST